MIPRPKEVLVLDSDEEWDSDDFELVERASAPKGKGKKSFADAAKRRKKR